jgi:hypothetical protein
MEAGAPSAQLGRAVGTRRHFLVTFRFMVTMTTLEDYKRARNQKRAKNPEENSMK